MSSLSLSKFKVLIKMQISEHPHTHTHILFCLFWVTYRLLIGIHVFKCGHLCIPDSAAHICSDRAYWFIHQPTNQTDQLSVLPINHSSHLLSTTPRTFANVWDFLGFPNGICLFLPIVPFVLGSFLLQLLWSFFLKLHSRKCHVIGLTCKLQYQPEVVVP